MLYLKFQSHLRYRRPSRYRGVNDERGAISLCVPSALPMAIGGITPSTVQTPLSDYGRTYQITENC
jgi:hypothetical protein